MKDDEVVLVLLAEREVLRAALNIAVSLLEEAQEALIERDDVCMDDVCMSEDGEDLIVAALVKARAALSGSAAP